MKVTRRTRYFPLCICYGVTLLASLAYGEDACGDYWFACPDGTCIIAWEFCDGRPDCSDGSDEIRYNESVYSSDEGIPCRNQQNIDNVCLLPLNQAEKTFICRKDATCSKDYLCSDGSGCIESSWFCNGYPDCSDGSDEVLYDPTTYSEKSGVPCRNSELKRICLLPEQQREKEDLVCTGDSTCEMGYLCANGWECVDSLLFCNGESDCSDGSDEMGIGSPAISVGDSIPCRQLAAKYICLLPIDQGMKADIMCTGDETCATGYLCRGGGACVHEFSFCDGIPDCSEGDDEVAFNESLHTIKDGVSCRNIFTNYVCLLEGNQAEKSEEICLGQETCILGFMCENGECIEVENFCDGKFDCSDQSDEIPAGMMTGNQGIPCRQGFSMQICMLREDQMDKNALICTGDDRCSERYLCSGGSECIPAEEFCDGIPNCSDLSDEIMYDEDEHSDADGVVCRGLRFLDNTCLLPNDQANKRDLLCRKETSCTDGYLCSDGLECIDKSLFCDMNVDCSDGSDEIYYVSAIYGAEDGIQCQGPLSQVVCLLPQNQAEKQDEICASATSDASCSGGYLCQNGWECVDIQNFCDGILDCSDGSDEFLYETSQPGINDGIQCRRLDSNYICLLPTHQLEKETLICTGDSKCANGYLCDNARECIERDEFCDGWSDCSDSSDEVPFDRSKHASKGGILCRGQKYFKNVCLLPKAQTGKKSTLCRQDAKCESGYMCSNGVECIDIWMFCSGNVHCSDGSDEITFNSSIHSKNDGVPCRRRGSEDVCLLPVHQTMKRKAICREELECKGAYLCADGSECVPPENFCDGQPHCSDGSDEIMYNTSEYTKKDGVACRGVGSKYICLLPNDQRTKKPLLCDADGICANGYLCSNGHECVDITGFCNGGQDCSDGSDEIPASTQEMKGTECRPSYSEYICLLPESQSSKKEMICTGDASCKGFLCGSGDQCITEDWFCDGSSECSDKSDEVPYNDTSMQTALELACSNTRKSNVFCLLPAKNWASRRCKRALPCHETMEFACANGWECIAFWMFCDGIPDCEDGSDELAYDSSVRKSDDELSCRSRRYMNNLCLLPAAQSGKRNSICARDATCRDGFLCSNGNECIPRSWFCDGIVQCSDGSDEVQYDAYRHTTADGIACRSVREKNVCLLPDREAGKVKILCKQDSCGEDFSCPNSDVCVDKWKFCDGHEQCRGGQDEIAFDLEADSVYDAVPCRSKTNVDNFCALPMSQLEKINSLCKSAEGCDPETEFACSNGIQCASISAFCNGVKDCGDGSDEVIYNTYLHSLKDGVHCRSRRYRYRICLLPSREARKQKSMCRRGF